MGCIGGTFARTETNCKCIVIEWAKFSVGVIVGHTASGVRLAENMGQR